MSWTNVYVLAIISNFLFSTASLVFSQYSKRFSPFWMNQFKVSVAFLAFLVSVLISQENILLSPQLMLLLLSSGFMGLCLGDQLLFRAYTTLGAGRSLVLYSFQPLILGLYGFIFLGQEFSTSKFFAILCMIICVLIFVFERNRVTGNWDFTSFLWAFSGIMLDAVGVMFTRSAYEIDSSLSSYQVNLIRAFGAILGFFILRPKSYLYLVKDCIKLPKKDLSTILVASLGGTFLSLSIYLYALKTAHVASLSSIAITGPLWVSILECLWFRRWPGRYQLLAFLFFLIGFYLM